MTVPPNPQELRQQLRQAVFDCRERGLTEAATWAAQQLSGLPKMASTSPRGGSGADQAQVEHEATPRFPPSHADNDESDVFLYAKSLFDNKVCRHCHRAGCRWHG